MDIIKQEFAEHSCLYSSEAHVSENIVTEYIWSYHILYIHSPYLCYMQRYTHKR